MSQSDSFDEEVKNLSIYVMQAMAAYQEEYGLTITVGLSTCALSRAIVGIITNEVDPDERAELTDLVCTTIRDNVKSKHN
jgi:hypothetical protein